MLSNSLLFLAQRPQHRMNSAFCVACTALCDKMGASDVRLAQSKHFVRAIEQANSVFQVPVLIGTLRFIALSPF